MNTDKKLTRVCMLNPQGYVQSPPSLGKTDTGGQTLYVLELARALGKKGIKVDIITRKFEDMPEEEAIFDNVKIIRIPSGPHEFIPKEDLYEFMPEMIDNLLQHINSRQKKYDIIHSHYWDGGYAGIILARVLKIPHVHIPHSLGKIKKIEMEKASEVSPAKLKSMYRYHVRIAAEQKIINSVDALVVICETSRIEIMQHYFVDFEKLHVIFPGIDTEIFTPKKTVIDREIDLQPHAILTASRIVPAKGLDRVAHALKLLKNTIPFHWYIGGGSDLGNFSKEEVDAQSELRGQIEADKLTDQVTFVGDMDHSIYLPAYYRSADAFVLASRYEPFGLTTMEAMACETVPIVSHIAGSREVIIDGLNGFIVNMDDTNALAERLTQVLTDEKLNKRIAENAKFTIQEHYSWDTIVEKFIELYMKLI